MPAHTAERNGSTSPPTNMNTWSTPSAAIDCRTNSVAFIPSALDVGDPGGGAAADGGVPDPLAARRHRQVALAPAVVEEPAAGEAIAVPAHAHGQRDDRSDLFAQPPPLGVAERRGPAPPIHARPVQHLVGDPVGPA